MKYSKMFFKLNKNENDTNSNKYSETIKQERTQNNNKKNDTNKKDSEDSSNRRSKRKIKVLKKEDYLSDNVSEKLSSSLEDENPIININKEDNVDIVMTGNLIYRFSLDQIELEGFWSLNNDVTRERFSYMFIKKCEKITCPIKISEIEQWNNINSGKLNDFNFQNNSNEENLNENYIYKDEYNISICSANLFEALVINHPTVFNCIINYLTGEYHGFFVYYDKTIEDRFYINFDYDDNQVRINGKIFFTKINFKLGEGTNSLGNFNLIGYINFYNMKESILRNNDIESDTINLGEFKMTRLYNAFNPNENYRVIKSFQHRKKKGYDYSDEN